MTTFVAGDRLRSKKSGKVYIYASGMHVQPLDAPGTIPVRDELWSETLTWWLPQDLEKVDADYVDPARVEHESH